jgi:cell division protease FtsH
MDGLREDAELLFVLTTNRPEELEPALSARPGRIDQAIEFPLPDAEGRLKLIDLYAGRLEIAPALKQSIVARTEGASAAFIKELMRRGAQYAIQGGSDSQLSESETASALDEMLFSGGSLNHKLLGVKSTKTGFQT